MNELKSDRIAIAEYVERQSQCIGRLIRLTDSVLLGEGKVTPKLALINIQPVLLQLTERYALLASSKPFNFSWQIDANLELWTDDSMIEDIIDNLLSNSFKYTRQGEVSLTAVSHDGKVEISCRDTGVGIPLSQLELVMQRNVRGENIDGTSGVGIGLSIVDSFVAKLSGTIKINSQVYQGTEVNIVFAQRSHPIENNAVAGNNSQELDDPDMGANEEKNQVMLVEDNLEIAAYYQSILNDEYATCVAHSAESALSLARQELPDLIVTDIMMGEMDGYQLVSLLRKDELTCHIPIVMLTAKADHAARIRGYDIGANDFIVKPVQPHELAIRVGNQLAQIRATRRKYSAVNEVKSEQQTLVNDRVVDAYLAYIKDHFAEVSLGTEMISEALFVTKKQLERKIKHYLEVTPNQHLANFRLETSRKKLLKGQKVKDVFYQCGFSSHAYFSKKFKEKFGVTPTEYVSKHKND